MGAWRARVAGTCVMTGRGRGSSRQAEEGPWAGGGWGAVGSRDGRAVLSGGPGAWLGAPLRSVEWVLSAASCPRRLDYPSGGRRSIPDEAPVSAQRSRLLAQDWQVGRARVAAG